MRNNGLRVHFVDLCSYLSFDSEGHVDGIVSICVDDLLTLVPFP